MKNLLFFVTFGLMWPIFAKASGLPEPTGLNDTDATDRNISLQWHASSGATEYRVYQVFSKDRKDLIMTISETDCVVTRVKPYHGSLSNIPLSPFTAYSFVVRASDGTIESDDSKGVTAMTTHRWIGTIRSCLTVESDIPTRRELESVTDFRCSDKNLTEADIEPVQDLKNIMTLYLNDNEIGGHFPEWMLNMTGLQELHLENNRLSGHIPTAIDRMVSLQKLYLNNNRLTGPIPASIGNLSMLWRLYLQHNRLTGSIPDEIGEADNLHYLYLSDNNLTGVIPSVVTQLPLTDGWGLDLTHNCHLYSDDLSVRDFIDQKGSYHGGYQNILDTNTLECFTPALIPIVIFELN